MAKVRKGAKRIGLVLSTSFSIFCLFSSFAAAYSWFSAVRAVNGKAGDGDGGGFQATETPLAFDRVDIYQQVENTSSSHFSTTATGSYSIGVSNGKLDVSYTGSDTLSFGSYDSLRDVGGKLLYLFHVRENLSEEEKASLHIKAYTETSEDDSLFKSKTEGSETTNKNPLKPSDNPVSNVLSYQVYTYTNNKTPFVNSSYYDLDTEDSNRTSVFVSEDKFVKKLDEFGYLSNESDSYLDTLSLLPAGSDTDNFTTVAVVVSFSKELFNNLFTINLGNDVLSGSADLSEEPKVAFKDDWGFRI